MAKNIKEAMMKSGQRRMKPQMPKDEEKDEYKRYAKSMRNDKMKPQSRKEWEERTRRQDKEDKELSSNYWID